MQMRQDIKDWVDAVTSGTLVVAASYLVVIVVCAGALYLMGAFR